jgi:hypothetical protein
MVDQYKLKIFYIVYQFLKHQRLMQIFIINLSHTTQTYEVSKNDCIETLKRNIIEKNNLEQQLNNLYPNDNRSHEELINLRYGGKLLKNDRTFEFYNVLPLSTIQFYLPLLNCKTTCKTTCK